MGVGVAGEMAPLFCTHTWKKQRQVCIAYRSREEHGDVAIRGHWDIAGVSFPALAHSHPALAHSNPTLTHSNPTLAHSNPALAHSHPTLAHRNPGLIAEAVRPSGSTQQPGQGSDD